MLDKIISFKKGNNSVKEFCDAVRQGLPSAIFGVNSSFKNYLVSQVDNKVLFVVKDMLCAQRYATLITQFSNKKVVILPPRDEVLLTTKAFSKDSLYQRISALHQLPMADVVVCTIQSLMQLFPKNVTELTLIRDCETTQADVIKKLVLMGYCRVEGVEAQGSFSVRGDVIDVFPIAKEHAYRIDFFGDYIESIKTFDTQTRKGISQEKEITILQASEFVFDTSSLKIIKDCILKERASCDRNRLARLSVVSDDALISIDNNDNDGLMNYAVVTDKCCTLFDLLPSDTVVVLDESKPLYESATLFEREFNERFNSLYSDGEVTSFQKGNLLSLEQVITCLKQFNLTTMQTLSTAVQFFNPLKIINCSVGSIVDYQLDFKEVFTDIQNWLSTGYRVCVCTATANRADNFAIELADRAINYHIDKSEVRDGVQIFTSALLDGFVFHEEKFVLLGSGNLYARPTQRIKGRKSAKAFFTAPETGDYCVHEVHGVGRVLGSKKISSSEGTKDYVAVEYQGGDILYVPVEQMDILTRYLGSEKKPRLSKIGGKDFERIKRNVKEGIKKMSFDLKQLYSQRQAQVGFKFSEDEELQKVFEDSFMFEDTVDQALANKDIKGDMTSGKVMDRLVCGDVGFGKTEVAFRAVFRAILNGKQAVMLAPTTILTEQHYTTALQRFKDFGVKIACLNRFRTPQQQKLILKALKEGEIDFIIGTHRLLSKDVEFKDLGLLVLDEEQRFGVEHKEKIKLLKHNVDTITLTATPIPRTLHMSLSGIREISTINTPPKKRLPVQTYVTELTDSLIKDAVSREINRGGQAFILYNRVESIDHFAEHVSSLMPNLKITVAHGQMEERKLEKCIMSFYNGESDVLISTTIIENGIDLPKANTLIVIDADRLGLSTLYQLKGRVGRSDRLAYAYFTFTRDKILSQTAYERLNAIIEFTEMGSGMKIAIRDLEIRGAGNILGAEQHGHMDKIGYELYSKLLKEELTGEEEIIPELDIRVTAFIPDEYMMSNSRRMDAYKQIAEIRTFEEEKEFVSSAQEVYGPLPREALNLVDIAVIKMLATKLGVSKITITRERADLEFADFSRLANAKIHTAISTFSDIVRLNMSGIPKVEFIGESKDGSLLLSSVREFLISCN